MQNVSRVAAIRSGQVTWSQNFRGKGSSLGNIFFLQNQTHFAIRQSKLHRTTCRRFDTIPACDRRTDRQTDVIAIASTALAMPALRRAVKNRLACCVRDVVCNEAVPFRPYSGGVVTRTRNVSEYILVLALCLVCSCDPGNFGSKTAQFANRLIIYGRPM